MKITDVKTFLVGVTRQSWLFVKGHKANPGRSRL